MPDQQSSWEESSDKSRSLRRLTLTDQPLSLRNISRLTREGGFHCHSCSAQDRCNTPSDTGGKETVGTKSGRNEDERLVLKRAHGDETGHVGWTQQRGEKYVPKQVLPIDIFTKERPARHSLRRLGRISTSSISVGTPRPSNKLDRETKENWPCCAIRRRISNLCS